MSDDQQTKQGLTPSPSLSTANSFKANTNADSTNGMKFLMVPGQNTQTNSISSGKLNCYCALAALARFLFIYIHCYGKR